MRVLPVLAVMTCCLVAPLGRGAASTLRDALTEAYMNNADLAAQRRALRATDAQLAEARAGYLPTLTGSLEYQLTRGESPSAFEFPATTGESDFSDYEALIESSDADTTTATLTLRQNLYNGGGTVASVSQARNQVLSGRAQVLSVEQTVLLDAATAYVSTWRDRAVLDQARENLTRYRAQLDDARRRYALGRVARTDVVQAEARVAGAMADAEGARSTLSDSEADYERVTNRPPDRLAEPTEAPDLPDSLDAAFTLANANPDAARARFDVAASKTGIATARADFLPSLDLQGQLSYTDDPNPQILSQRTAQIGVTLTVPFYRGGATVARLRGARETARQREQEFEGALRNIRRDIRSAWDALRSARARGDGHRLEMRANEAVLNGVEQEAYLGRRTVLDILDAQQDLYDSRVDLVRARADFLTAGYRLKASVGQLNVRDLDLPVQP